jgi:hypothetical protein
MSSIFRKPTEEEIKDFNNLMDNQLNLKTKFLKKLEVKQREYLKKRKLFCARCARIDFEKENEEKLKLLEETLGNINKDKIKIDLDNFDFDKYANLDRFKFGKLVNNEYYPDLIRSEVQKRTLVDGIARKIIDGYFYNFVCNVRACGHTMEISFNQDKDFLEYLEQNKEFAKTIKKENFKKPYEEENKNKILE